jgi:putative intracellular protease/amidase
MPGAQTFAGSHVIHALVKDFFANGRLLGLICAAPIVLREARLSGGRETWVEGKIRLSASFDDLSA